MADQAPLRSRWRPGAVISMNGAVFGPAVALEVETEPVLVHDAALAGRPGDVDHCARRPEDTDSLRVATGGDPHPARPTDNAPAMATAANAPRAGRGSRPVPNLRALVRAPVP